MSFLARFRILTKILAIMVLMAVIAASISWVSMRAPASLHGGADKAISAAKRALTKVQANQNVLTLSRSEFRPALEARKT